MLAARSRRPRVGCSRTAALASFLLLLLLRLCWLLLLQQSGAAAAVARRRASVAGRRRVGGRVLRGGCRRGRGTRVAVAQADLDRDGVDAQRDAE